MQSLNPAPPGTNTAQLGHADQLLQLSSIGLEGLDIIWRIVFNINKAPLCFFLEIQGIFRLKIVQLNFAY